MSDNEKPTPTPVRDEINELTALATHKRTGYDLDACRTDALMMQALWKPQDSINAIIHFLEGQFGEKTVPENNQGGPGTTTNGKT